MDLYATIQDVRDRGVDEDAADDLTITRALARARLMIDAYCGRDFLRRYETYWLDGSGAAALFLEDRPVVRITRLYVDGIKVEPESYRLYEEAGYIRLVGDRTIFMGHPGTFPRGEQNVEVSGTFGFDELPDEVKEACILLALMFVRMLLKEGVVAETQAEALANARIRSVSVDDLSVSYEYHRDNGTVTGSRRSTGLTEADRLLWRHRRDLEAMAI